MGKLPVVKEEIARTLLQQPTAINDIAKYLLEENMEIAKHILACSKISKDPETTAYCALMTYHLLKSQAEADDLNKLL